MTLQQIMYFQRVARSGSFTKAARACFVSQTAISRQISALEAVPAGQRRGGHRPAALFRAQIPAPGPVQRAHRRPAVELQLPAHFPPGAQPRQRARHV